jgi:hypothetical protein
LLELTLRACAASGQAEEIASWLREEGWPAHLATFVEKANEFHQSGGGRCSVCGRDIVVPMTSWIEFRQIGRTTVTKNGDGGEVCRFMGLVGESEGPVPFMRVGCSWRCVPARVEVESDYPEVPEAEGKVDGNDLQAVGLA